MSLSIPFSTEWFQADHDSQLSATPSGGFRLNTTSEGGGMELQPGRLGSSAWQEYDFMNAEVYHNSHDVLVLLFSFRDQDSRMITYHAGILPGVRTVICLPLKHLNGEKLFLDRYPGVMQTVLRGDARVDRKRIAGFSIGTIPSTTTRSVEISGLSLSRAEPDFTYEYHPYIDGLGQLKGRDWQGKTASQAELTERLHSERMLAAAAAADFSGSRLSRYGGWRGLAFQATGYFRTEFDGSNWWFADPDGYALFSTGMDCVGPASPMRVTGMEHLTLQLPEREGSYQEAWSQEGREFSSGIANLITTFGPEWRSAWTELTDYRLRQWGYNTIGNWSDDAFIKGSKLPYVYPLSDFPATELTIRDFPDVFSREYEQNAEEFAKQLVPLCGDIG